MLAPVLINGIQIQKVAGDPVFCLHKVTVADGDGKRRVESEWLLHDASGQFKIRFILN